MAAMSQRQSTPDDSEWVNDIHCGCKEVDGIVCTPLLNRPVALAHQLC